MKAKLACITLFMFLFTNLSIAQVIDPAEEAKKEATGRANKNIDEGINKAFDKLEGGVKGIFGKKKKKNKGNEGNAEMVTASESNEGTSPDLNWAKFDFVSGNEVIFEDNQTEEENGEFPSRWDLVEGRAENAHFDFSNVIYFMSGDSKIIPFLENPNEDYLPDVFTLEFDAWFEKDEYANYEVYFFDQKNQEYMDIQPVQIYSNMISLYLNNNFKGFYPGTQEEYAEEGMWRHVSMAFNKRSLKVYLDDARVLNVPNLGINPQGITIGVDAFNTAGIKGVNRFVKNVRLAEGGTKLYDKYLQDGKIVASGIRFDTNNSNLKPESMGVINRINRIMNENPEINFSVEGHTDSDGEEIFNQRLSEERAAVVLDKLVAMGIDKSRLKSKGLGENAPITSNETPEGKANNRRVEFVKF